MKIDLAACFAKGATGDGVDYKVARNGVMLASGVLTTTAAVNGITLSVTAGDKIDFSFGPNKTYGGDSFFYRARISEKGQGKPVACPTA